MVQDQLAIGAAPNLELDAVRTEIGGQLVGLDRVLRRSRGCASMSIDERCHHIVSICRKSPCEQDYHAATVKEPGELPAHPPRHVNAVTIPFRSVPDRTRCDFPSNLLEAPWP